MDKPVNIGPQQRQTRKQMGYVLLAAAVIFALIHLSSELSAWWLVLLFALTQNGIVLVLEAKHGVCPVNAMRGKQSMSGKFSLGQEDFAKPELSGKIKEVTYKDLTISSVSAAMVTLIVYLISVSL